MLNFKIEFEPYIPPSKTLDIGTLGPGGSSSEYVSTYVVNQLQTENLKVSTQLYDSFLQVKEALLKNEINLALVPHAYDRINEFYMEPNLELGFIFIYPTPVYGLAKKKDHFVSLKGAKIVTHPAPLPLLSKLLPDTITPEDVTVELSFATSAAARQVKQGSADLAITNENAALIYDLEFISTYGNISMSWSIFQKKWRQDEE